MRKALPALVGVAIALASPAAGQRLTLSEADRDFLLTTARGNNYQLEAARLAHFQVAAAELRAYADSMIVDHTRMAEDLNAALLKADSTLELPEGVDSTQLARLDSLRKAGDRFEVLYKRQMIASHEELERSFLAYTARSGAHPAIRAVVREVIPGERRHLARARTLPGG